MVVLERALGPSEVDTGITLWPFATRALLELGLTDRELSALGGPLERLVNLDAKGRVLSEVDLRPPWGEPLGHDVHRARLETALTEALGVERIRYGARCVGVKADAVSATALLEDGSAVSGDILVGADGVRSVVRRHVAGPVPIRSAAVGVWRGNAELDQTVVPAGIHIRIYGPGGVFGVARLDQRRVRWYAGGRRDIADRGTAPEVQARFGRWCEPAAAALAATPEDNLLFNDTPRVRPLRRWTRSRVALLGDAAHAALPTLGASGGLAIADAVALGRALARTPRGDKALVEYARERQPIGRRAQWEAEAFGLVLAPSRPRLVRTRNRMLGPPFAAIQRRGVEHLVCGAERPFVAHLFGSRADSGSGAAVDGLDPEPGTPVALCLSALRHATGAERGPMELHSRRVLHIAEWLAAARGWNADREVLACAALLHDIGLYDEWWSGRAYVVDSRRAGEQILASRWSSDRLDRCLAAIEFHHAVGEVHRHGEEAELIRSADLVDITAGLVRSGLPRARLRVLFGELPRTGFPAHMAGLIARRSVQRPTSWLGVFSSGGA